MRYIFKFALLLILLHLFSCTNPHEYIVGEEFTQYVKQFELEAKLRGKTIDLESAGLIVEFADLKDNEAGLCHYEKPIRIEIDKTYWNAISASVNAGLMKEELMFHELGHGVLGRAHLNTLLENGDWKSLMCGGDKLGTRPWNINYHGVRRTYYIDELFDERTSAPEFANTKLTTDTIGFATKVFFNFDSNKKADTGWEAIDNNGYNISFENKKLKFSSKISSSYILLISTNVNILSDFTFECDIQCQSASGQNQFGIVYGDNVNNAENLEYLSINNDQKMYMGNRKCYSFFTELERKEIIPNGNNQLKIIKTGNILYYFINNTYTYNSEPEISTQGNQFGFIVPGNGTVWMDNFRIAAKNTNVSFIKSQQLNTYNYTISVAKETKSEYLK